MERIFWIAFGALIAAAIGAAIAQQGVQTVVGCIAHATAPTFTESQIVPLQCDLNGKLRNNAT